MLHEFIAVISGAVLYVIEALGYWGIFLLSVLESANIPVPSEVILPFSGFLASRGVFDFWTVVFLGGFGNLVGSLVSYYLAYYYGRKPVVFLSKYLLLREEDLEKAETWFKRFGILSVFIARFVPVIRTFISFPAGMFKVNIWKFTLLTFVGSFLWSAVLTWLGFVLGENWETLGGYFRQFDYAIAILFILIAAWWVWRHFKQRQAKASE